MLQNSCAVQLTKVIGLPILVSPNPHHDYKSEPTHEQFLASLFQEVAIASATDAVIPFLTRHDETTDPPRFRVFPLDKGKA